MAIIFLTLGLVHLKAFSSYIATPCGLKAPRNC